MKFSQLAVLLLSVGGCGAQEKALRPENQPTAVLRVVAPPTLKLGDSLMVVAELTNLGDKAIVMENGGKELMTDFLRAATDSQVYSLPGPVWTAELDIKTVAPGETFRVTRYWDARNGAGNAVPAGLYKIRPRALLPAEFRVSVDATPVTFVVMH